MGSPPWLPLLHALRRLSHYASPISRIRSRSLLYWPLLVSIWQHTRSVTSKHCQLTTRVAACTRAGHPGPGRPCLLHWRTVLYLGAAQVQSLATRETLGARVSAGITTQYWTPSNSTGPGQAHIYWALRSPTSSVLPAWTSARHCEPEKPYGAPYPRPGHTHSTGPWETLWQPGFLLCRPQRRTWVGSSTAAARGPGKPYGGPYLRP